MAVHPKFIRKVDMEGLESQRPGFQLLTPNADVLARALNNRKGIWVSGANTSSSATNVQTHTYYFLVDRRGEKLLDLLQNYVINGAHNQYANGHVLIGTALNAGHGFKTTTGRKLDPIPVHALYIQSNPDYLHYVESAVIPELISLIMK